MPLLYSWFHLGYVSGRQLEFGEISFPGNTGVQPKPGEMQEKRETQNRKETEGAIGEQT